MSGDEIDVLLMLARTHLGRSGAKDTQSAAIDFVGSRLKRGWALTSFEDAHRRLFEQDAGRPRMPLPAMSAEPRPMASAHL